MRTEQEVLELVMSFASGDPRIRALTLHGSRVNPTVKKDIFQDYDICFIVNDLESFKLDPNWVDLFGERLIMQCPEDMNLDDSNIQKDQNTLTYLMLFKDFNRIDLKLILIDDMDLHLDSLTRVLLDKDKIVKNRTDPSDIDYRIKPPTQKEFSDCCNEFWWVSTYVSKGLIRDELIYSIAILNGPMRDMLFRMINWVIGHENNYTVNIGNYNRYIKNHVSPELWTQIGSIYPILERNSIKSAQNNLMTIFDQQSRVIAEFNNFALTDSDKIAALTYRDYVSASMQR